jgi:hypothetical protein
LLKPLPLPWWDLRTASGDLPAVDLDATVRFADQTNHRRALVQYWRHLHELEKDRAKKPN